MTLKLIPIALLTSCVLWAGTHRNQQLGEVHAYMKGLKSLVAPFHQTKKLSQLGLEIKSKGKLRLSRPDKTEPFSVIWEVLEPAYLKVTLDKEGISIFKNKNEVKKKLDANMGSESAKQGYQMLLALLSLNIDELEKNFKIVELNPKSFEFTPNATQSPFKKITMTFNKNLTLKQLNILESSNDEMHLIFLPPKVKTFK